MRWCVTKTGFIMFDALHAYGVGLLLAAATTSPIMVRDKGPTYQLSTKAYPPSAVSLDIIDQLLALPALTTLTTDASSPRTSSLEVATLDGLLALLFTTGGRMASINDSVTPLQKTINPLTAQKGLHKVTQAIHKWKDFLQKTVPSTTPWFSDLLKYYHPEHPASVIPVPRDKGLTAYMTLDPAFAYALRSPWSDGMITQKVNLALQGIPYATLLANIGAAHFLRAQRIASHQVSLSVPLVRQLKITADMARPLCYPTGRDSSYALASQVLELFCDAWKSKRAVWKGLAFQILQTQGIQQSISLENGVIDGTWYEELVHQAGRRVIHFWRACLSDPKLWSKDEQGRLVDMLVTRQPGVLSAHLQDLCRHLYKREKPSLRQQRVDVYPYSLKEVRLMAHSLGEVPLSHILERKEGTVAFGHALRLLAGQNASIVLEIIEQLEGVQTKDQLNHIVYSIAHECNFARARTDYILVPSDNDFRILHQDIEQHGVRLIASTLMALSALSYPKRESVTKYDLSTLIQALLALITYSKQCEIPSDQPAETERSERIFFADEGDPEP